VKQFLFIFLLLLPHSALAQPKLWFSNKVEVGYGKIFVGEKIAFENGVFTKNSVTTGLKFKVAESINLKAFYLLENALVNKWKKNHFLGMKLDLKLQ
jgi:hypothetical protein